MAGSNRLSAPPAFYAGCIDELEFFKRALSDQEIVSLWNAGGAGKCRPTIKVFINEWLASNLDDIVDPADGQHDDWFEIYNPGTNAANLAGLYLTDDLNNTTKFAFPPDQTIPPGGFLLVWADGEPQQNDPNSPDLHVAFTLADGGGNIGLFAADGTLVDAIIFGAQTADVSEGRWPDGGSNRYFMTRTTAGAPNVVSNLPTCNPANNLIVNGSFEQPIIAGTGQQLAAVPGWTTACGPTGTGGLIELWRNPAGIPASVGNQHLEINGDLNVETVCQTVTVCPNVPAAFCFDYTGRYASPAQNAFQVDVVDANGIAFFTMPFAPAVFGAWQPFFVVLNPPTAAITIRFTSTPNTATTGGAHIDNVILTQTDTQAPTPCPMAGPGYFANFNSGPSGMSLYGSAVVGGGALKLTGNINNRRGVAVVPLFNGLSRIHSFRARFRLYIGGGTTADGFSFNLIDPLLPTAFPYNNYEEGVAGAGLTVEFDTFDNDGIGTADNIGIFIKSPGGPGGTLVSAPGANPNPSQGSSVTSPGWKIVEIRFDSCGHVEVYYDGQLRANGQINYIPAPGARFVLATRTGGLNDNHWVDNLSITIGKCVDDVVVNLPPGQCCAVVNYVPCFTDNCDPNLSIVCTPPATTSFCVGVHRVCCAATDATGNVGFCGFYVIVNDLTPPMIDCSQIPTLSSNDCVSFVPNYLPVFATDDCTPVGQLVFTQSPTPGTAVGPGSHIVTITVCDASGNCASCTTIFTVTAPLKPIPGLASTGVDNNGQPTLPCSTPDPHYSSVGFIPVVTCNPAALGWKPNDTCSQWISPTISGAGATASFYVYSLSFYLDSACTNDVCIMGEWCSSGTPGTPATMSLNGGTSVSTSASAISPSLFNLTSGFQSDLNTLTFTVPTEHSANGLRVCIKEAIYRCCECGPGAPSGLVLWLPHDEPNTFNVAHNVSGGNNGNYFGAPLPTVNANGYVDRSLCFNGMNQYVRVPYYAAIDVSMGVRGNLSIDAWVNRDVNDTANPSALSQ